MGHGPTGGVLRYFLSGVRGAFARTAEAGLAGGRPGDQVALLVGQRNVRVVERGQNGGDA